jgi:hypothetical protein
LTPASKLRFANSSPESLPKSDELSEMSEYFFFLLDAFFFVSTSLAGESTELRLELRRDFFDFFDFFFRLRE